MKARAGTLEAVLAEEGLAGVVLAAHAVVAAAAGHDEGRDHLVPDAHVRHARPERDDGPAHLTLWLVACVFLEFALHALAVSKTKTEPL